MLLLTLTLALVVVGVVAPAAALASAAVDMRGTWSDEGEFAQTQTITSMNMETGEFSGTGVANNGTGYTWPTHGVVKGYEVTWVLGPYDQVSNYTATCTGTVSSDGTSVTGACSDTFGHNGAPGSWKFTHSSSSREEPGAKEKEAKEKEEREKGKRRAAIQVNCDAFNPGLADEYFQCTAQLGDASGASPAERPTGTVHFALNPGGGGGILGSGTCALTASQTGGASSFCAVSYLPPAGGIALGSQPPVTATYSGDSVFGSVSGSPQGIATTKPRSARSELEGLCESAFSPACEGVVPEPPGLTQACFSLTGCGSGSGEDTGASIVLAPDQPSLVAEASCPAADGSCEEVAAVEGQLDPEIKARLEYEENYSVYIKRVAVERAATIQSTIDYVRETASATREGTPEQIKESEERANALIKALSARLNQVYDSLARAGTDNSGYVPITPDAVGNMCRDAVNKADCTAFWTNIGDVLKASADRLNREKAALGVNVSTKIFAKGKGASATAESGASIARHSSRTRGGRLKRRSTVLAASGKIRLRGGARGKIRMRIPGYAHAKLRAALARHARSIRMTLVVYLATDRGAFRVRRVPVVVRLRGARRRGH